MSTAARIDELRRKFEENPRRYFAPLANEYRKAGELGQAIALCREYLPKQPGHMSGYIVFGQALYESGSLVEARTVFEQALALDPENLIALRHLGDIAKASGDPLVARRWYERVLDADPRNDDIAAQLASLASMHTAARATPQSAAPAVPSAGSASLPPVPSFGLGAMPTPDATLRAVDFDIVNKRMSRYTPLDLDAIEADANVEPLAGHPAHAPEIATGETAQPNAAYDASRDIDEAASAADPFFGTFDQHPVERDRSVDPLHDHDEHREHAANANASSLDDADDVVPGELSPLSAHDAFTMFARTEVHSNEAIPADSADRAAELGAEFEIDADAHHIDAPLHALAKPETADESETSAAPHEASRSVNDALGAFALYDPTDELQSDHYATGAISADLADQTHESSPVVPSAEAPIASDDAFEEGIVAPEWPVAADLIAQVATPRFFIPHVIHPTPDAIAAFGREPHEPADYPHDEHDTHEHRDDVAAELDAHLEQHPAHRADVDRSTPMSVDAFDAISGVAPADAPATHEPEANPISASTEAEPFSAHHDAVAHEVVAHDASASGLLDDEHDEEDESLVFESAEHDTSLPWLSTPDEVGFSADPERAVDEIAAMFESDARASGDDSAVTVASLETYHPQAEPIPVEASFADVVAADSNEISGDPDDEIGSTPSSASPAFVTETMAELLVSQGFLARAVGVYEELVLRNPYDAVLASRLDALRTRLMAEASERTHSSADAEYESSHATHGLVSIDESSTSPEAERDSASLTPAFGAQAHPTPAYPAPVYPASAQPTPRFGTPSYPTPAHATPAHATPMFGAAISPAPTPSFSPAFPPPAFPTPTYATPLFAAALPGTPATGAPALTTPSYGTSANDSMPFATPAGAMAAFAPTVLTARERFARLAARRVPRRTPPVATPAVHDAPDGLAELFGAGSAVAVDDTAARAFADAFAPMPGAATASSAFLDFDQTDAVSASDGRVPTPRSNDAQRATPSSGDANAGFSFDRFFPDPAMRSAPTSPESTHPSGESATAPDTATPVGDDLAQFSAWLKGLGTT